MFLLRQLIRGCAVGLGLLGVSVLASFVINEYSLYLGLALMLILDLLILVYAAKWLNTLWRSFAAYRYLREYEPISLRYCLRKRLTLPQAKAAHELHRQTRHSGDEMNYCQLTIKDFLEETR